MSVSVDRTKFNRGTSPPLRTQAQRLLVPGMGDSKLKQGLFEMTRAEVVEEKHLNRCISKEAVTRIVPGLHNRRA